MAFDQVGVLGLVAVQETMVIANHPLNIAFQDQALIPSSSAQNPDARSRGQVALSFVPAVEALARAVTLTDVPPREVSVEEHVDSESEAKEGDIRLDVSVGVRRPKRKRLVQSHVNSESEENDSDSGPDLSAGLNSPTHKRNVIEVSSWSDVSDDGLPIRRLRRSNRAQTSVQQSRHLPRQEATSKKPRRPTRPQSSAKQSQQSTCGHAVSTRGEGDDLYLFLTIDDRRDTFVVDEAGDVGIQVDTAGERSGMTADDSGLCVFNSLRIVLELAGIACDALDSTFEAFIKKRRDDKKPELSDGADQSTLVAFVRLLRKRRVKLSVKHLIGQAKGSIYGVDKFLQLSLPVGIYLVGVYDVGKPPIGHCFAISVHGNGFFIVESTKSGSYRYLRVDGNYDWIYEIRFVYPIVPHGT
ncbi:hypothetical protein FI667_g16908, partial [Globisporangium splendens]